MLSSDDSDCVECPTMAIGNQNTQRILDLCMEDLCAADPSIVDQLEMENGIPTILRRVCEHLVGRPPFDRVFGEGAEEKLMMAQLFKFSGKLSNEARSHARIAFHTDSRCWPQDGVSSRGESRSPRKVCNLLCMCFGPGGVCLSGVLAA